MAGPGAYLVTGIGLVSPLGADAESVVGAIRAGRSGLRPATSFDGSGLRGRFYGEVDLPEPVTGLGPRDAWKIDRGTRMAVQACALALESAGLDPRRPPRRIGLCVGASGSSQYQNLPYTPTGGLTASRRIALYHARNVPHFQAAAIARALELRGPRFTFSCASAASALAIQYGLTLLRARRAECVLVGGGEAITLVNMVGMDVLGLSSAGPCAPFSGAGGMSFGEGAAFLVVEPAEHARRRGARAFGELLGCGVSSDAHDAVSTDPSGNGVQRAFRWSLERAGLTPADVGWVKASGTGNRAQDLAETQAMKQLYAGAPVPPLSSLEPFLGHANGAAPAMGVAAALWCRSAGIVAPTLNLAEPRRGCDLDYVGEGPRPVRADVVACTSMAFGGLNAVVVVGDPRRVVRPSPRSEDDVLLTGIGVVSPIACGTWELADALASGRCGIGPISGFAVPDVTAARAGLVDDAAARRLLHGVEVRRADRIRRYALAASLAALRDAGLEPGSMAPERLGLIVSMAHGPCGAQETFLENLCRAPVGASTGRQLLRMGRFAIASELCVALRIQGYSTTVSGGISSGLQALVAGGELLRDGLPQDAMLVVAADEIGALFLRLYDRVGVLSPSRFAPYDPRAEGIVLGEGAVALLLERSGAARARRGGCHARLEAFASSAEPGPFLGADRDGRALASAVAEVLTGGGADQDRIDVVYGHGRGLAAHDRMEAEVLHRALGGRRAPYGCVTGNTGVAEASCGLLTAAAAALGMRRGEAYPVVTDGALEGESFVRGGVRRGRYRRALVAGAAEDGNAAAVILAGEGADAAGG